MVKRSITRIFCIGLLLAMGLCGCKKGTSDYSQKEEAVEEYAPKDPDNVKGEEPAVSAPQTTLEQGCESPVATMELLQYENPEEENLADLLQKNGAGMMVQVRCGSLLGSGLIYDCTQKQIMILTAAHVLSDLNIGKGDSKDKADQRGAESGKEVTEKTEIQVKLVDGSETVADLLYCSKETDMALLCVEFEETAEKAGMQLDRYVKAYVDAEAFDGVQPGDGCIVMGSRSGVAAECYEGRILDKWAYMEDYDQYMTWVKAEGIPGMSGGGLFDLQGRLLGILSGVSEEELAVVPLNLILRELSAEPF